MSIYVRERRYILRTDGFASLHAGAQPGELTTRPFRFRGEQLAINYSTSAAGSVRIEIQDTEGRPVPGYALSDCLPLVGDSIEHTVGWKQGSDVSPLIGQTVRLRWTLTDADVFSFRFQDSPVR